MTALCDIETAQDVKRLVDAFYAKVNCDELLAPIFNETAHVDWPKHLPTMYRFWQSVLFGSGNYQGAPFPKHAVLQCSSHISNGGSLCSRKRSTKTSLDQRARKRKAALCALPIRSRVAWVC
jgi:hypothetical protein